MAMGFGERGGDEDKIRDKERVGLTHVVAREVVDVGLGQHGVV
jgi:hypothetical protein